MPTVVVQHNVGNFDTWLKGHTERQQIFAPAVSSFKTFQNAKDPNSITLVLEVTDMDKLMALINDPKTQEAKDRHTVKEPLHVFTPVAI